MVRTPLPVEKDRCFCPSCGARYESEDSSKILVEVRESPISLERKFTDLVRAVFRWRLRKRALIGGPLIFDRRSVFGASTALIVRSPDLKHPPFPSHEWADLELAVRDPFIFEKTIMLASQFQMVTGRRAVVIKEF